MDLDFADEIAVFAEDNDKLQRITERLSQEVGDIGLRISPEKSKVMHIGITSPRDGIYIRSDRLEVVNKFTYLGSTIANDGDAEIDRLERCGSAPAFVAYVLPPDYDDEDVEAFYVEREKFYKKNHTFYKVIVGDFNDKIELRVAGRTPHRNPRFEVKRAR
ncbi:unnamed protein product [Heligmosomoides polygyrus]|uniref:Reverse transcriptase domain-containing protein n=1 Tax=Heligmosomoides polygyrus TaxID=6339 RepID=A0A183G4T5_HELPZ|nr:unnamed protein product [Heligmosomoides polygyrus]